MREPLDPLTDAYEYLDESALSMYIEGFRADTQDAADRSAKALQIWDLLVDLGLALPPEWLVAVWHTQDVERARKSED